MKEICHVIFYALAIYVNRLNTIKGKQNYKTKTKTKTLLISALY